MDLVRTRPNCHAQLAVAIHLYLKTCSADALGGLRRDHIFSFGDIWIFNAALGLLKFLEPHLLLQDDMILGKLLKSIVPTRLQFEGGAYPPEAYGPLNYRTAARTLFLRPYLAHFCPFFLVFSRFSPS